jgi:hypothetical protein
MTSKRPSTSVRDEPMRRPSATTHLPVTRLRTLVVSVSALVVAVLAVAGADSSTTTTGAPQVCPVSQPTREATVSYERPTPTTGATAPTPRDAGLVSAQEHDRLRSAQAHLPLTFVANAGQWDARVRFAASGTSYAYRFLADGVLMSFSRGSTEQSVRLRPVDPDPGATLESGGRAAERVSYHLGSARYPDLAVSHEVVYRDLWPGIDLVFRGRGADLEYEFHVAPGADPSRIRLAYDGAGALSLGGDGDLRLDTAFGSLRAPRPQTSQVHDGNRVAVDSRYALDHATGTFGFAFGAFDPNRALVVGLGPRYSTLIGGSANDFGIDIAVDRKGNAYVTGQTMSDDFPSMVGLDDRGAAADAFVAKLDPTGTKLLYASYLGGSASEAGLSIAVDDAGRAYVSGGTGSPDFPTTPGAFDTTDHPNEDVWVAKLDATGSKLLYSTLLGGSAIAGDFGAALAIDRAGHAYVAGGSGSPDFPSTPGTYQPDHRGDVNSLDAYVAKLKPDGSGLVFATFVGGRCRDAVTGIAVDDRQQIYLTGSTVSKDFPTTTGAFQASERGDEDAFVAKLNAKGSRLLYSTLLGGRNLDKAQGIALADDGQATVTGWTTSSDFPTTRGALGARHQGGEDAFVTRLSADGSRAQYSTYLGGSANDRGRGVAVDPDGNAYVAGGTASPNFPTARSAAATTPGALDDAFVVKLSPRGSRLVYSTRLGGDGVDFARAIAVDADRDAYATGRTESTDFPHTSALSGGASAGGREAFVVKLDRRGR